jgi:hypothetical protein
MKTNNHHEHNANAECEYNDDRYTLGHPFLMLSNQMSGQSTFQKIFGDNSTTETGKFRVTAVTGACSTTVTYAGGDTVTGGYIAVGSSNWDAANN